MKALFIFMISLGVFSHASNNVACSHGKNGKLDESTAYSPEKVNKTAGSKAQQGRKNTK